MNVLVILGHPRADSLCGALADAYADGARAAGMTVRRLAVTELDFDPNVRAPDPREQPQEDDIDRAAALVDWAHHLAFVYPTWWGTMPSLMKAFLDRVLMPGFAFSYRDDGHGWDKLLTGRTAELITTMDTPGWVYRWIYGAPGHRAMSRATLGFCGVETVGIRRFGPVEGSTAGRRAGWLSEAEARGRRLAGGARSRARRVRRTAASWLQALRLQFYPMTLLAYWVGALAVSAGGGLPRPAAFWAGFALLFLVEAATVFTNDYVDLPSDRRNRNFGPFSGGSRVAVTGRLPRDALVAGAAACLAGAALAAAGVFAWSPAPDAVLAVLIGVPVLLALAYTVPPARLSWRGLGELDVAATHGIGPVVCGWVFQGGAWAAADIWLLSVPLFLGILPAITLSGIPDHEADAAVGKRTLSVRLGRRGAAYFAIALTVAAAVAGTALSVSGIANGAYDGLAFVAIPAAALVVWVVGRTLRDGGPAGRIDGAMAASLTYIMVFVVVPLVNLL